MQDWDHFRVILTLARKQTLRASAESLSVNHATISRRLQSISRYYGGEIFERINGRYHLTELGKQVHNAAENIEKIVIANHRNKRANEVDLSGKINLSIPPAIAQYLLLDELYQFQQLYPEITLHIDTSYQLADLDRCEADIVIRADNQPAEHLVGRRLCNIAVSYYGAINYINNTPKEQLQWITKPFEIEPPDWIAKSPFPHAKAGLKIADLDLRHHAAIAGYGLTLGACYMADPEPKLTRLTHANAIPFQQLWVLTHPDLRNVPRIKELMEFIATTLLAKAPLIEGREA